MLARMPAIHSSVLPALIDSGGLNTGTPLLMASTPVSAVHPEAKARKMSKTVRSVVMGIWLAVVGFTGAPPAYSRTRPATMRTKRVTMKK